MDLPDFLSTMDLDAECGEPERQVEHVGRYESKICIARPAGIPWKQEKVHRGDGNLLQNPENPGCQFGFSERQVVPVRHAVLNHQVRIRFRGTLSRGSVFHGASNLGVTACRSKHRSNSGTGGFRRYFVIEISRLWRSRTPGEDYGILAGNAVLHQGWAVEIPHFFSFRTTVDWFTLRILAIS